MSSKIDAETEKMRKLEEQLAQQKEKITKLKKAEQVKARKTSTQNKIKVGGAVLAILRNIRFPGYNAADGYQDGYLPYDELAIADFLKAQEERGSYFSQYVEQWHAKNDARLLAEETAKREERNRKRREKRKSEAEETETPSGFFAN